MCGLETTYKGEKNLKPKPCLIRAKVNSTYSEVQDNVKVLEIASFRVREYMRVPWW